MSAHEEIIKTIHIAAFSGLNLEPGSEMDWCDRLIDLIEEYAKERGEAAYKLGLKHGNTKSTSVDVTFNYDFDKYLSDFWSDSPAQFMNARQEAEAVREWICMNYTILRKVENKDEH